MTVTSDWSMLGRYSTNMLRKVNFILFHMVHLFIYLLIYLCIDLHVQQFINLFYYVCVLFLFNV